MLDINQITFAGAIPIGSQALQVNTEWPDYDFVMLREDFHRLTYNNYVEQENDIKHYFTAYPRTGHNTMVSKIKIREGLADVILFEHKSDVEIVRKAMSNMTGYSKKYLKHKRQRVALFEQHLIKLGFTEPWERKLAKCMLKLNKIYHKINLYIRSF